MKHFISASRKTDIPAFYMDWFMNRIREGYTYVHNSYRNEVKSVSLRQDDVASILFWSKNYLPSLKHMISLKDAGYRLFFHYTITGQGKNTEKFVLSPEKSIDTFQRLADEFSAQQVHWRFDPIFYTNRKNRQFYIEKFEDLASQLEGYTHRCTISFVDMYPKVQKAIKRELTTETPAVISPREQLELVASLVAIAEKYGIQLFSCCEDTLATVNGVTKGSCMDVPYLSEIFHLLGETKVSPTREECGCYKSFDIGYYNTCPHGCVYCYANRSHASALNNYRNHNKSSRLIVDNPTVQIIDN